MQNVFNISKTNKGKGYNNNKNKKTVRKFNNKKLSKQIKKREKIKGLIKYLCEQKSSNGG